MKLLLLAFSLSIKASECDIAKTLRERLMGHLAPQYYRNATDCCFERFFVCATQNDAYVNPPQILELYILILTFRSWAESGISGSIDVSIANLVHLMKIDISDNSALQLPESINSLPNLKEM